MEPSYSTILLVFVYPTLVVFMLLHYLSTTLSLLCLHTEVHLVHFICRSSSHSLHLRQSTSRTLLIIVYYFHICHIWSYSCYIVIQPYFHNILRIMPLYDIRFYLNIFIHELTSRRMHQRLILRTYHFLINFMNNNIVVHIDLQKSRYKGGNKK